jgi:hypothetical protein
MLTVVTPPVYSEDEHSIASLLTEHSRQHATHIQNQLTQLFGDAIWLQAPPSLHITLMEIICDTEYAGPSRKQQFMEWHEKYGQRAKEVIARFPPCQLTFSELIVSPRAVIIKATNPAALNDIRAALLAETTLPADTKMPPDIAHCTLARFTKAIDLEYAIRKTNGITVDFEEHITGFALLKDLGPPDFTYAALEQYPLGRSTP